MKSRFCLLIVILLTVSLSVAQAQSIHVAAAANLERVMTDTLIPVFEKKSGMSVIPVFGATGVLAKQLENGAPYDVFVSADTKTVDKLAAEGLVDPKSERVYAVGQLVMWTRTDSGIHVKVLADLLQPGIHHVSVANPQTAPYGAAATASLTNLGLLSELNPKIVYAENIQQALEFAQTGNADVALTAYSLVEGVPGGETTLVSDKLHPPIAQALAVSSTAPAAARQFADFLAGRASAKIWRGSGYLLPRR